MMSMKDTTDRGETHVRYVGFYNDAEDALAVIRTAKIKAQDAMMKEMEKLRAVLEAQHARIVGSRSETSEVQWEKDCKEMSNNVETDIEELCFWTEHEMRAEMED